jgi:hypothetical protein
VEERRRGSGRLARHALTYSGGGCQVPSCALASELLDQAWALDAPEPAAGAVLYGLVFWQPASVQPTILAFDERPGDVEPRATDAAVDSVAAVVVEEAPEAVAPLPRWVEASAREGGGSRRQTTAARSPSPGGDMKRRRRSSRRSFTRSRSTTPPWRMPRSQPRPVSRVRRSSSHAHRIAVGACALRTSVCCSGSGQC